MPLIILRRLLRRLRIVRKPIIMLIKNAGLGLFREVLELLHWD
jgi:short-subunit dehydrogenase